MTERDDALKELGRMAAERRESVGMTLEDVFDRTRIRPEYLKGIEEGDYKNFPEIVYIKGFVRTYLKLIGAEDLQDDFIAQLDRTQSPKRQEQNVNILGNGSTFPEGFKPASHFWLFLALIAALAGTGAYVWYAIVYGGLDFRKLKLFNFSGTGSPGAFISQNISSGDSTPQKGQNEENNIASVDIVIEEGPEPEIRPSLEIHAVNDVWLRVTIGNNIVYNRTMRRGESGTWDLTAPARVVFGRPTAAQVILNGQDLGIVNPRARKAETYIYQPDGTFRMATRN